MLDLTKGCERPVLGSAKSPTTKEVMVSRGPDALARLWPRCLTACTLVSDLLHRTASRLARERLSGRPTSTLPRSKVSHPPPLLFLQVLISRSGFTALLVGTTHFVNGIIQRDTERLDRVAVIRSAASVSSPAYSARSPLCPPSVQPLRTLLSIDASLLELPLRAARHPRGTLLLRRGCDPSDRLFDRGARPIADLCLVR